MSIPARVAAEAAQADRQLAELAAVVSAPLEPAPAAPPEPAPAPAPAPSPPVQPSSEAAELQRLRQQLSTMSGRLEATAAETLVLRGRLEEATRTAPPAPPAPAPVSLITDEERKEYGEDLLGLIGRVFQQSIGTKLDDLGTRLAGLEGKIGNTARQVQQVQQVTQQTVHQRYVAALDEGIPGWATVNEDPGFLDWLQNPDIVSGKSYMDLLADAHSKADAGRVIHIFRLYKPELGAGTPPAAVAPAPVAPAPASHIDPGSLAAPATSAPAPPPNNQPTGALWTKADVDKLYDDKMKGRLTVSEFDKREKEYLAALAEGRVSTT